LPQFVTAAKEKKKKELTSAVCEKNIDGNGIKTGVEQLYNE